MEHNERHEPAAVRLEPWGAEDLALLTMLNEPEMTRYVGGAETPEKVAERQAGYEEANSRQYRVVVDPDGEGVGWVGYWDLAWRGQQVWEVGWAIIPVFQGQGVASSATAQLLERARGERSHRFVHAFPKIDNGPSNAICRKLDFELLEEVELEGRRGGLVRCNDWRFVLFGHPDQ